MLFSQGSGMVFFDLGMLVLSAIACAVSFATYRSKSIDGTPVADHVRAIKAAAWATMAVFMVGTLSAYGDAPLSGVCLVVLWLLAFSDIVAGLARIGARLQVEQAEARRGPSTVAQPHR